MPRGKNGEIPLPGGWEEGRDYDGKLFYIDHNSQKTTWIDPRDRFTKPQTFADCVGNELPYGWEQAYDMSIGMYFINHLTESNQLEDPRQQWREEQQEMLKDYLVTAQEDLAATKEIYSVKEQRLQLAQEEYQHFNETLCGWKSSHTSLNSNSSVGSTKYDPDLLKADVTLAKRRVARLKQELEQVRAEVQYKEQGVETLAAVDQKLSSMDGGYSVDEAHAIMDQIKQTKQCLSLEEKQKQELMQTLAQLKDDLTIAKNNGSSPDVSTLSIPQEKASTASQTDLTGELGVESGNKLAQRTRLRLHYDELKKTMVALKLQLAKVQSQMVPGQKESDKDRLLLLQEKEQLLRELKCIDQKGRNENELVSISLRIHGLEEDLRDALEISNKQISDRLKLEEQKNKIFQQLQNTSKLVTLLESQLKCSSTSQLSVSSGSSFGSLGSLGSLSASSLGSLASTSMTDIYGQPQLGCENLQDLHRKVGQLLQGHSIAPGQNGDVAISATPGYLQSTMASSELSSMQSLSPHSSLSSISPPISPYDIGPPPSYEQHMNAVERQKRLAMVNTAVMSNSCVYDLSKIAIDQNLLPQKMNSMPVSVSLPSPSYIASASEVDTTALGGSSKSRTPCIDNVDIMSNPPLSPISESSSGVCNNLSGGNTRSVSTAVSDESVAGDSGVFEASVKRAGDLDDVLQMNLESAQIQINLKYDGNEGQLHVAVEEARNLGALPLPERSRVCIKTALLPLTAAVWETKPSSNLKNPHFAEVFKVAIPEQKLYAKTLQVHVWCIQDHKDQQCLVKQLAVETLLALTRPHLSQFSNWPMTAFQLDPLIWLTCVGCAHISLADFNSKEISSRWYNILSFEFMQNDLKQNLKREALIGNRNQTPNTVSSRGSTPVKDANDKIAQLLEASSARLRKTSLTNEDRGSVENPKEGRVIHPSVKEESSDESTIISSQTSTLTRNQGPEAMESHQDEVQEKEKEGEEEEEEDEVDDENEHDYSEIILDIMNEFEQTVDIMDKSTQDESPSIRTCDKETNTEGDFVVHKTKKCSRDSTRQNTIRRSQTFSPADRQGGNYVCKLNRSDSDSSMSLYKRRPFQRNTVERRSLRWKKLSGTAGMIPAGKKLTFRTSVDLELDLQASQTRLSHLRDDVYRLKELKRRMEEAKFRGENELPSWLTDDENFQRLLSEADKLVSKKEHVNSCSKQDKRAEQLMKKVTREVQKLQRSNNLQAKAHLFREKMAFFTTVNMTVPVIPSDGGDERLEDFLKDERTGEEV